MTRTAIAFVLAALAVPASAQVQALRWQGAEASPAELAQQDAQADAHRAYMLRTAEALARSGDARELAFAALLRRLETAPQDSEPPAGDAPSMRAPRDAQAEAWLRAASANAGDDRLANLLLVAAIDDPASPLRAQAAARWQAADPGNLSPLLYAGRPVDGLLVEARRATRADARMYDAVRWMMSALQRHPPTPAEAAALAGGEAFHADEAAAVSAMGLWAATAMPAYGALVEGCRGDALRATPTRGADCRHVARLLAAAGSAGDRGVGLWLLHALADSPEARAAVAAQRRRMDWQMLQWGRTVQQQPRDGAAQFVRLLGDAAITTEQQLLERVLQEAGVPLEPPAGWSPPRG